MSGQNRKQSSNSNGAILSTLAAVGIGAIAAAGAFFVGKALGEDAAEEKIKSQLNTHHQYQNRQYQNRAYLAQPSVSATQDDEIDVLKKCTSDVVEALEKECVICMCEFEELKRMDVEIHTTPCGHIFCGKCIERCLRNNPQCPTCKRSVYAGQTLRIFL